MLNIMQESGFCHGVKQAINSANQQIEAIQAGQKVYLYGDLVNNSYVMDKYKSQGYMVTTDIGQITPGATVVIRAHGLPKAVCDQLQALDITLIDATCTKVKNTHKIVSSAPGKVVIVGKKDHPEVIGICGWCGDTAPQVIESAEDFAAIDYGDGPPVTVVGQTTCKYPFWQQATQHILAQQPLAIIHQTLCQVTTIKSQKAAELAQQMDTMVVVGDSQSSNSIELYHTCKGHCENTFFVSDLGDFMDAGVAVDPHENIGLVASASTPEEITIEIADYIHFMIFATKAKGEIDGHMAATLDTVLATKAGIARGALEDFIQQNQGGKGIRGYMIRLGEEIAGGNAASAAASTAVSVAFEMFQTAILIHDDIIDNAATRRGKPTIHAKDPNHYGIARGICIGDYGFFLANQIIATAPDLPADTKIKILDQFAQIQITTLEGEMLDIIPPALQLDPATDYDAYMAQVMAIYKNKTAWYTLIGPMMLGAMAANATAETIAALTAIAMPLGIAFQIKDDILGIFADEKLLGKPAISDVREKKQTILYGYAYKHATEAQRAQLQAIYGNPTAADDSLFIVQEIFQATGALAYARQQILDLSAAAREKIQQAGFASHHQSILGGLVSYLIMRGV